MKPVTPDRRAVAAGLGLLAAQPALAAVEKTKAPSPIAHGVLADNMLAKAFEPVATELPGVHLWTLGNRKKHIDDLKGHTILMPLWAEWCPPCISELPDFARLQQKFGNDRFAIVPILTGTQKKFTPEYLADLFGKMRCGVFEPLIENSLGDRLFRNMARQGLGWTLPCNLIIAPDGRVVGREMGRINNDEDENPAQTATEMINRTATGAVQSAWGLKDGEDFAKAMAEGFLG
jgi:thiol-disulfide isomerase/thioredoxin